MLDWDFGGDVSGMDDGTTERAIWRLPDWDINKWALDYRFGCCGFQFFEYNPANLQDIQKNNKFYNNFMIDYIPYIDFFHLILHFLIVNRPIFACNTSKINQYINQYR